MSSSLRPHLLPIFLAAWLAACAGTAPPPAPTSVPAPPPAPVDAAAPPAPAGSEWSDPERELPLDPAVRSGKLANGLTYYVRGHGRPDDRAELRLVVNAGSILEDDDQRGLAHFVEHMAFNGTEHFARQELVDYLESIGMRFGPDLNAYTSFDETVYMLKVPTDDAEILDRAFLILRDWAGGLAFEDEEVDKERGSSSRNGARDAARELGCVTGSTPSSSAARAMPSACPSATRR